MALSKKGKTRKAPAQLTPERMERNAAIARAHDRWVDECLTDETPFRSAGRKSGSDYGQHYLDVDGATLDQEDRFREMIGEELGEIPMTQEAPVESKVSGRVAAMAELKFGGRRVASPAGAARWGKRIGELIRGHTFMTPEKIEREFGRRRGSWTYSQDGADRVSAYDGGVLVHSVEGDSYEHDVAAVMTPDAATDIASAMHRVMTGLHRMSQNEPDEIYADDDTNLVSQLTEVTPGGATVGIRPDGQVFVSYVADTNYGSDDHLLEWAEATSLMQALSNAGHVGDLPDTTGDPDIDETDGYDLEQDPATGNYYRVYPDGRTEWDPEEKGIVNRATTTERGRRILGAERATLARDIVRRYTSGESIRSLARSIDRSYGFIHQILTESGVQLRQRGGARRRHRI